ncbi:hypothetical protein C8J56DRAFT_184457 [Mycena floridula]|nr:hypothetical protein C8J56DRAFT_184457 [Mycena floridula]
MSTSNNSRRLRSPPLEPLNELLVHDFRQFSLIISPKPSGSSREQRRPFLFCDDATFDSESRPSLLLSDDGTSDGSSILSYSTASSSSTVKGVGMVSGRLIKALGRRTLEAAENLNIRRRLAAIRNMVQTKPAVFLIRRYAEGSQGSFQKERKAALDAIDDLRELYDQDMRKIFGKLPCISSKISQTYISMRVPHSPRLLTIGNWSSLFLD